jgi:16S rRNA C1402 (ribose-2'-O) methylase RsmI
LFKQFKPRKNSKRQQELAENEKKTEFIKCEKCKKSHTTLYKVKDSEGNVKYYCREHRPVKENV